MANNIKLTLLFENRYKGFAKKFKSLESDVDALIEELSRNPTTGEALGAGLYKIRLAVKSKGKGKSGGFRVIMYLVSQTDTDTDIYLITLYDKSEESTIKKEALVALAKQLVD